MDEDFSMEFPELSNLPSFNIEEEISPSDNANSTNQNIEKIYEYLEKDAELENVLLSKLKEFESKLDIYLNDT